MKQVIIIILAILCVITIILNFSAVCQGFSIILKRIQNLLNGKD